LLREEFEMKKLLVLALVMANGGFSPGEEIKINVIASFEIISFGLDVRVLNGYGEVLHTGVFIPDGSIYDAGTLDIEIFDTLPNAGLVVNEGETLLTGARGAIFGGPPLPAGEYIYSFTYVMPDLEDSIAITIKSAGTVVFLGAESESVTEVADLVIHTPEPITIALLGLGGLFLRRRK
jgi:hypothetical protein